MAVVDDRELKIQLAKEKLKKFQKKKAGISDSPTVAASSSRSSEISEPPHQSDHPFPVDEHIPKFQDGFPYNTETHHPSSFPVQSNTWSNEASQTTTNSAAVHHYSYVVNGSQATNHSVSFEHGEISSLHQRIEELTRQNNMLRRELELEKASVEGKILSEHQTLREQLNSHIQTIGMLVAEKTELHASLSQAENVAKRKAVEVEKYAEKLSELHEKLTSYERQSTERASNQDQDAKNSSELTLQIDELKAVSERYKSQLDLSREENFEIRRKLDAKENELLSIQNRFMELESRLEMMKSSAATDSTRTADDTTAMELTQEKRVLEARIIEHQKEIANLRGDMEKMVAQYQSLLSQVTASQDRSSNLQELEWKLNEATAENDVLTNTLTTLEEDKRILQHQVEELRGQVRHLQDSFDSASLQAEQKNLQMQVLMDQTAEKERIMSDLQAINNTLRDSYQDRDELLRVMESDRVALSNAMSQNQQLKQRLEEMASATAVQHSVLQQSVPESDAVFPPTRENPKSEVDVQTEPEGLFQLSTHMDMSVQLSSQLKIADARIRNLEDELTMYKNRIVEADAEVIYLKNTLLMKEEEAKLLNMTEKIGAYRTLEHRFIEAMKKNAELEDEIDKLQHVTMQLQGETETIGDYIALYQNQRNLWRQRDYEKNAQVQNLIREREDLKAKVHKLQHLIREQLSRLQGGIVDQETQSGEPVEHHIELVQSGDVPDSSESPSQNENVSPIGDGKENLEESVVVSSAGDPASEILKLLDDIDAHIAADPQTTTDEYEPRFEQKSLFRSVDHGPYCSCCTGELKTV